MDKFTEGVVVQLKSGGPKMTCFRVEGDRVFCQWFSGSKLVDGGFSKNTLNLVELEAAKQTGKKE